MAAGLVGKWKCDRNENFDDYLKALGVGMVGRKMAGSSKPTMEIKIDGDKVEVMVDGPKGKRTNTFTVGQETEIDMPNGKKVKGTPTIEGDKLIINAVGEAGKHHKITREVVGGELVQTNELEGVECKRYFKKV